MAPHPPTPGQTWHLPDLVRGPKDFLTMIGNYQIDQPTPFLNEMSIHFFRLKKGAVDTQRPHRQDELYYVLDGSRTLYVKSNGKETNVSLKTGDLVYVPAAAEHRFIGDEEISLLVFFAPNYTGSVGE
ncbi:MAG: cupin domain-containing protein [Bacteroidota bacterium]